MPKYKLRKKVDLREAKEEAIEETSSLDELKRTLDSIILDIKRKTYRQA